MNGKNSVQLPSKIKPDRDAAIEFVGRMCNTKSCNRCEKILAFHQSFPELIQRGCRAISQIPMCCRNASKIFSTGFWKPFLNNHWLSLLTRVNKDITNLIYISPRHHSIIFFSVIPFNGQCFIQPIFMVPDYTISSLHRDGMDSVHIHSSRMLEHLPPIANSWLFRLVPKFDGLDDDELSYTSHPGYND